MFKGKPEKEWKNERMKENKQRKPLIGEGVANDDIVDDICLINWGFSNNKQILNLP